MRLCVCGGSKAIAEWVVHQYSYTSLEDNKPVCSDVMRKGVKNRIVVWIICTQSRTMWLKCTTCGCFDCKKSKNTPLSLEKWSCSLQEATFWNVFLKECGVWLYILVILAEFVSFVNWSIFSIVRKERMWLTILMLMFYANVLVSPLPRGRVFTRGRSRSEYVGLENKHANTRILIYLCLLCFLGCQSSPEWMWRVMLNQFSSIFI